MAVQLKSHERFHIPSLTDLHSRHVPSEKTYSIVQLGARDRGAVTKFLKKFFFQDEPLNIAIGVDANEPCPDLEEYATSPVEQGLSVAAVAPDGSMVGVCINMACTIQDDAENRANWATIANNLPADASRLTDNNSRFAQIKKLLERVCAESDVFKQYPGADRLFDINILSVDDGWRGMGIAKKLLERSRELAQDEGFRLVRCICSSHFSALAVSRLGYHCIHSLDYMDVKDAKGNAVFKTAPPHNQITTYVKQI